MKIFLFSILLIGNLQFIFAQDRAMPASQNVSTYGLQDQYAKEAIYLKTTFWGQKYVKNGKEYRIGFMGKQIKKEFAGYPLAEIEFQKYRKSLKTGKVIGLTCLGLVTVGLSSYFVRTADTADEAPNATESALYFGGLFGIIAAVPWSINRSSNALSKAVFLRNQAICEGK